MHIIKIILISIFGFIGIVLFFAIIALAAIIINPKIIVKRMRKGDTEPDKNLSFPKDYQENLDKVNIISDLEYKSNFHNAFYDIYYPKTANEKLPTIIWVHGGSFIAGTRYGIVNVAVMLAAKGYCVVAADYAFVPEAKHPAAVIQMQELYQHLINAKHPQMDLNNIFIAGDSAGAQIASEFIASQTNDELRNSIGIEKVIAKDSLKGAILTCGPYDLPNIRKSKNKFLRFGLYLLGKSMFEGRPWHKSKGALQSQTAKHISPDFPPTYITDGNVFSFEVQGRRLGEALREKNVPVTERYFDIKDGEVPHEYLFKLADENAQICFNDILSFLNTNKSEKFQP